ncbi:MAG: fibronectin type III domain-containing protein, partial [Candidatus Magasanikbacteria bacterium]|nr:fibronectin type III domain-containing protein [Candidatus Magasanikbacteria bacterium]
FTVTWDTDELSDSFIDYIMIPGGDFSNAPSVGTVSLADTEAGIGEHQVIVTGLTPNAMYYFQVRSIDPSNNVGTSTPSPDGHIVTTLSGPSISDVGVSDISNTQVSVTWTTDQSSDSYVYYSLDNAFTSSTVVGNADSVTDHSVTLPNLTRGTTYYYYVKSGVGEDKNVVDGEIMYHTFTTLNDQTPPIITFDEESDIEISDTAMIVTWSTNEPATTALEYGTSTSYGTAISNDDLNTSHNYTISGLTLGTLYYVRFTNTDLNGNASNPTEFSTTTADSTDYTPPVITSVTTTVVTDDEALITWITDEGSTSQVYYGTSSSTLDLFSTTNANYDRTHGVILSSLSTSTEYFYYVVSVDLSGNTATSSPVESFATLETLSEESEVLLREQAAAAAVPTTSGGGGGGGSTQDSTPPIISDAEVAEVTGVAAKLTWSTNEIADSVVEFGETTDYGKAGVNLERKLAHEIVLTDLLPLTDYYYRISSADRSGNRSAFSTGSFTTTLSDAPISTTSSTEDIVDSDAAEEMFMMSMQRVRELIKNLSTQVSVEVLESTLLDQTSVIQELSELLPRPVIGGQPVVDESANTATISWTTDKASNSLIEFVSESGFAQTGVYSQTVGESAVYTTEHSVQIQGLNPSTPYRYRLISRTPTGAESTSRDFSFTTKAQSIEIGSYKIAVISPEEAVFSWSTSLPTDSSVSYAPYRNGVPSVEARQIVRDVSIVSDHSITLTGLEGGVIYDVELIGRDTAGNTASKLIQGFSTDDTDAPPVIAQIKTDSSIIPGAKDRIQVIVSWVTNELSTSQVFYRSGFGTEGAEFGESTTIDSNYTKKHIVVVTNFEPGSVYQFVVESKDSSGNVGRSKTLTVLTPQKEESVFQVIMGNFEDLFGWVGKLRR